MGPLVPITIAEHTRHCDGSTGSECVACGMPKIASEIPGVFMSARTLAFIYPAMMDGHDGQIRYSESVQVMSHGQNDGAGGRRDKSLEQ
jgi:hypothetical protein